MSYLQVWQWDCLYRFTIVKLRGGQFASDFFLPEVSYCAISVKDKHRQDNLHTDHENDFDYVKILGLLNSNWQPKDGGEFIHGEETVVHETNKLCSIRSPNYALCIPNQIS